jgi:ElaA protein
MCYFKCKPFSELTTDELYELMALRQEVFVVEQNCPYLDADGKDQQAWHLMGFDKNEKLIAYARIAPQGVFYENYVSIGRIVTSPSVRGKGIGKKLMVACFEAIEKLFKNQPVKISAQYYLIRFYESFGFETIGEQYLEDDIPHIAMIRE